jgi:hypothetical protein
MYVTYMSTLNHFCYLYGTIKVQNMTNMHTYGISDICGIPHTWRFSELNLYICRALCIMNFSEVSFTFVYNISWGTGHNIGILTILSPAKWKPQTKFQQISEIVIQLHTQRWWQMHLAPWWIVDCRENWSTEKEASANTAFTIHFTLILPCPGI